MEVIEIQDRDIFVMGDIHGEFHIAYARDGIKHACIILAGDCGFGFHNFKYYLGACTARRKSGWNAMTTSSSVCAETMMTPPTMPESSSMKNG